MVIRRGKWSRKRLTGGTQVVKLFSGSLPITADLVPFVGVGGEEVGDQRWRFKRQIESKGLARDC